MTTFIQPKENYFKYILLFILTFITCLVAGAQWGNYNFLEISNWIYGWQYAVLILTFLSAHEFGHYFAARYYKINTSLPYYIPFPIPIVLNFGTFGAIIRMREPIQSKKALFDIGIAGPIAGYVVSLIFLIIGFMNLPTEYDIFKIHPEYLTEFGGSIPQIGLHFGDTLMFWLFKWLFVPNGGFMPPMNEIYHFPFLNVGWFGLFVTSMNLLPIGQLDGGHIVYAMFGRKVHYRIARSTMWFLVGIGAIGSVYEIYMFLQGTFNSQIMQSFQEYLYPKLHWVYQNYPFLSQFWAGWLLWGLIGKFFIKLHHPPAIDETPIGKGRMILGWFAIFMLISSFSINAIWIK